MGAYWLPDLPDWLDAAGLEVRCWAGWEQRSRSSGGYDQLWAVIVHHTASNTSPDNDCRYMWDNADDRPIGAILLERSGRVTIGAAGATNCAGKGGPFATSHGTIPLDKGNAYAFNIEAANAGTGEAWTDDQLDAYTILVATLCDRLDLDPLRDVVAHAEWAPDRKIDPAGPDRYATGSATWDMDAFRADVDTAGVIPIPPPDDLTEEQVDEILAAIAALQKDVDGLVTNGANRYKDLESKIQRNNNNISALATNESNRYKQYVGWHDETLEAITGAESSTTMLMAVEPEE